MLAVHAVTECAAAWASGASFRPVDLHQVERRLRSASTPSGPLPAPNSLHVLMLPDFDRADAIGSYWANPRTRVFAELLVECEEDRTLRAVLVGMLREADR